MDNTAVFPVLIGEIAKRKIKKADIAKNLGICDKALYNKLQGIASFTLEEALFLRNTYFPDKTVEEIFARSK